MRTFTRRPTALLMAAALLLLGLTQVAGATAADERVDAYARGMLAAAAFWGPLPVTDGVERCRRLLDEAGGNRYVEGSVLHVLGALAAMQGRFEQARDLVDQGAHQRQPASALRLRLRAVPPQPAWCGIARSIRSSISTGVRSERADGGSGLVDVRSLDLLGCDQAAGRDLGLLAGHACLRWMSGEQQLLPDQRTTQPRHRCEARGISMRAARPLVLGLGLRGEPLAGLVAVAATAGEGGAFGLFDSSFTVPFA
jgi:hypothetical protein